MSVDDNGLSGKHPLQAYWDAGFRSILPQKPRSKVPALKQWQAMEATDTSVAAWSRFSDYGVCVRCDDVCAIDFDAAQHGRDFADDILALTRRVLGAVPVRYGRPGRWLLLYRIDGGLATRFKLYLGPKDENGERPQIETRGVRQQIVAEGIHPETGEPYRWEPSSGVVGVGFDGLQTVTEDDVAAFFEQAAEHADLIHDLPVDLRTSRTCREMAAEAQAGLTAPEAVFRAVMEALPNDEDEPAPTRDDWVAVGHALKAASADAPEAGLDAWLEWSSRWPGGYDPEDAEANWKRFAPPYRVGIDYLVNLAGEHAPGGVPAAVRSWQAEAAFADDGDEAGEPATGNRPAPEPSDEELAEAAAEAGENPVVEEAFGSYVYAEHQERFVNLKNGEMLSKAQFKDRFSCPEMPTSSTKNNAATTYIETRERRRMVQSVTFLPGRKRLVRLEDGRTAVNVWTRNAAPAGAEDAPGDDAVSMWLDLLHRLVPDATERKTVVQWLAHLIQRPAEPRNWALVLGGGQGIGKDSLIAPLEALLARDAMAVVPKSELLGSFTEWYFQRELVIVPEVRGWSDADVNTLKDYVTRPPSQVRINMKGIRPFSTPKAASFVLFTNYQDALQVDEDDRRFFVIWSPAKALAPGEREAWFGRYHDWLENGGAWAVCRWLASVDLAGFSAGGAAPLTAAKRAMREVTRDPLEEWLVTSAAEGEAPFGDRDLVGNREILDAVPARITRSRHVTLRSLRLVMERIGWRPVGPEQLRPRAALALGHTRMRAWAVRRVELYEQLGHEALVEKFHEQAAREAASPANGGFGEEDDLEQGKD